VEKKTPNDASLARRICGMSIPRIAGARVAKSIPCFRTLIAAFALLLGQPGCRRPAPTSISSRNLEKAWTVDHGRGPGNRLAECGGIPEISACINWNMHLIRIASAR
jgi:hypothetical protein